MKFLCVACDEPMKLQDAMPAEDPGTLAVVYCCPRCDHQMAMLTNPWETQLVQSLGIRIGGNETGSSGTQEAGGCPFAGMVQGLDPPAEAATAAVDAAAEVSDTVATEPAPASPAPGAATIPWTEAARARLERIPEFVRPMARQGIEHWARDQGWPEITEEVLEAARGGMGL